jgi:hypothetical protein
VKTEFRRTFAKDLENVRDKQPRQRVKEVIETVERIDSLQGMGVSRN